MEIKLDTKTILEKEFKTGLRGYNQEDVDLFLDQVIQDYEAFKKTISELRMENERLKDELAAQAKRPAATNTNTTNFDLLKRISNLEKHVFGSKLYDYE
ncbi:cell division regulator GpsB [Sporosarcina thermotolerans]|uniref:Cell division regulator GpsB n=1 Tax=Sporosarcina thermotolerans TaxID=633404 RepID=A0AAW9A5Y1_9BACL|nr:cell division regulator GpsB [Sporosarcina thermotolerans]MDW0115519.1 cell division regulator GpsB [Sporosarcina thermotolerans]WHT47165.1 cell division regulator GpsB [Sporosarcina thermotolerans]